MPASTIAGSPDQDGGRRSRRGWARAALLRPEEESGLDQRPASGCGGQYPAHRRRFVQTSQAFTAASAAAATSCNDLRMDRRKSEAPPPTRRPRGGEKLCPGSVGFGSPRGRGARKRISSIITDAVVRVAGPAGASCRT